MPTRRLRGSTISSAGCRPACSSSRCCASTSSCGRLLVAFMASAPRMAEAVIHRAHVMDGLIDPAFADEVSRRAAAGRQGRRVPRRGARLPGGDRPRPHHRAGAAVPDRGGSALGHDRRRRGPGEQFTALAETLLQPAVRLRCAREFEKRHGVVPGAQAALLGFGKMASREMTMTSDLDFIMLYELGEADESNGDEAAGGEPLFRAADPAAGRGGDRADRRGRALRGRHAAAAVGQCRAAGDQPSGVRRLSPRQRLDVGAPCAEPRPRGGGRWRHGRADRARRSPRSSGGRATSRRPSTTWSRCAR